jgi:hypothetical protein
MANQGRPAGGWLFEARRRQRRDLADHLLGLVLGRRFFAAADIGFFEDRAALGSGVDFGLWLVHGELRCMWSELRS